MNFIGAGDHCRREQGKRCILKKAETREAHPQSAQPCESDKAVSREVSRLANVVMDHGPTPVTDGAKKMLPNPAQRTGSTIGAKVFRRLGGDDKDADCYRKPSANPVEKCIWFFR